MSTSQHAPMRRMRRPPQTAAGEIRGSLSPQEVEMEGSVACHSPNRDPDERFDNVLMSSRSTASFHRLHTPSTAAKASTFAEAPLASSPQISVRHGGAAMLATFDAFARTQRVDNVVSSKEDGGRGSKPELRVPQSVTPEKMVAPSMSDGGHGNPTSPARTNGDGKAEETPTRPVEESLTFEFYSTNQQAHQHSRNPVNASSKANTSTTDPRLPRGIVGYPCRESPMAPNMLPMVPIPDSFSQRYTMSLSSRDQQADGRYAAMSQSSRFEDANQLTPRPADGEAPFEEGRARHRIPALDDMVRHSTNDSLMADEGSAQPPRVDASMTSQNFVRNYKRRHTVSGTAGRGCGGAVVGGAGRYTSTSMSGSPPLSADVSGGAASIGETVAPELFASDQLTRMPAAHGKRRGGHQTAAEGDTVTASPQDGSVLATPSADALSPAMDDFSIVRAPVSGLWAKVLGNVAVDEDEAAEDPEARELLAQQIHNFVSKVVRQRHGGLPDESPLPQSLRSRQPSTASPPTSSAAETRADILRRANAEAASEVHPRPSPSTTPPGTSAHHNSAVAQATKATKATRRVRFNLDGLVPRDGEGPNALRMPAHSASRRTGDTAKRPLSPPLLSRHSGDGAAPQRGTNLWDVDAETSLEDCRQSNAVDVRSLLRAGVSEPILASPLASAMEASVDEAEVVVRRYAAANASTGSHGEGLPRAKDGDVSEDKPCSTPVTSTAVSCLPTTTLPGPQAPPPPKSVPVPSAPALLTQLTSSSQEPQRRRRSAGKVRKATKMHRKAAVALVAGAADAVTVARSSNSSSVQHSQLTPLCPPPGCVLSSMEVRMSEGGSRLKSSPPPAQMQASLTSPMLQAFSPTSATPTKNATSAHATGAHVVSPKQAPAADKEVDTPTHRIRISALQPCSPSTTSPTKAVAAEAAVAAPPAPSALHGAPPRKPSAATATATSLRSVDSGACGPARRTSAGSGGTHAGGATAPSSRRSSLSLACGPTAKSGTFMALPPLSASTRSHVSTPDVVAPSDASTDTVAAATALMAGEGSVLPPSALLRRPSASHDTVTSSRSARDYAHTASPTPTLGQERSCSTAEYRAERELSPSSTASDNSNAGSASKLQLCTHVLPRLSSSSLRAKSVSQTMSPPSA